MNPPAALALTEKRVAALLPPREGYTLHRDAGRGFAPGLAVRVTSTGARAYVFEKRLRGTVRVTIDSTGARRRRRRSTTVRMTIGSTSVWKLEVARDEARRLATLIDRGEDPRDERDAKAAAKAAAAEAAKVEARRGELTLVAAWDRYIKDRRSLWGERHYLNHVKLAQAGGQRKKKRGGKGLTTPGPLASLMPLKLSELTPERVSAWVKREGAKRPTNTAQSYRLLRAFVVWTAEVPEYRGVIPADAVTARAVRDFVPPGNERDDYLQVEQLPAWFAAVRALPNPVVSAYLQGLLLTGARRSELAGLRWTDVEFGVAPSLTIRDKVESKGGEDGTRTIPLTPYLASLLQSLPRVNQWVFSSTAGERGRLVDPHKQHNRALKTAGRPHLTLHGLRRSFSSLSEWTETPVGVVAQIMGHKPSATVEKHYKVRPLDLLRVWHTKLEAFVLERGAVQFVPVPSGKLGVVKRDGTVRAS
jgi:integrase